MPDTISPLRHEDVGTAASRQLTAGAAASIDCWTSQARQLSGVPRGGVRGSERVKGSLACQLKLLLLRHDRQYDLIKKRVRMRQNMLF